MEEYYCPFSGKECGVNCAWYIERAELANIDENGAAQYQYENSCAFLERLEDISTNIADLASELSSGLAISTRTIVDAIESE